MARGESRPLLSAHGLKVGYGAGAAFAVPDFSLSVGDVLCVTGANGAGKTTLLRTLAGLLPPLGGEWHGPPPRGVGYLPQQGPLQDDFPASVREVVQSGCLALRGLRPFYTFTERRRAERIMARLGLSALARTSYRDLSGGQRQRVLIARALAAPHSLLLLDEPTSALDAETADAFLRLVGERAEKGTAIVMVTHDAALAASARARLVMGEGARFEEGPAHA